MGLATTIFYTMQYCGPLNYLKRTIIELGDLRAQVVLVRVKLSLLEPTQF